MSQVKTRKNALGKICIAVALFVAAACGRKSSTTEEQSLDNVHVNFYLHASTMLLGVSDAQVSEITVQRSGCADNADPIDYNLKIIPSEKLFVLNEQRSVLEGCVLQIRAMKLTWKDLTVEFKVSKEQLTASQTFEAVLANSSKSAFVNLSMPYKMSTAVERNVFWSVNLSYVDDKIRLFPIVAEAREPGVDSLGLAISSLEDRGVVNTIWREFGVSLSCGALQSLGTCNKYDLLGLTARLVLQKDIDLGVAQQIRYQGGLNDLLFTAGLTHLVGSGVRFTMAMPVAYFGQKLYLVVMRGQGYAVFDVQPGTVPSASK